MLIAFGHLARMKKLSSKVEFCVLMLLSFCYFQDQTNIETKIKNIRFIGELCKFKIAPAALVFSCLKVWVFRDEIYIGLLDCSALLL